MELTDKIIAALSAFFVAALGAIGYLIVRLRTTNSKIRIVESSESVKVERARAKIADERKREALDEWRELYNQGLEERNKIRAEVDKLTEHRLQCEIELSAVKTQLQELLEWKSSLESSG